MSYNETDYISPDADTYASEQMRMYDYEYKRGRDCAKAECIAIVRAWMKSVEPAFAWTLDELARKMEEWVR